MCTCHHTHGASHPENRLENGLKRTKNSLVLWEVPPTKVSNVVIEAFMKQEIRVPSLRLFRTWVLNGIDRGVASRVWPFGHPFRSNALPAPDQSNQTQRAKPLRTGPLPYRTWRSAQPGREPQQVHSRRGFQKPPNKQAVGRSWLRSVWIWFV